MSKQNNPDKNIQKQQKSQKLNWTNIRMVADGALDNETDITLQEVERKQNVWKALMYVFIFFVRTRMETWIDFWIQKCLNCRKRMFWIHLFPELKNDGNTQMLISELFIEYTSIPGIVHSLHNEIVHKYLMVCHKQLLKDIKDKLNIVKKKAPKQEIKKREKKIKHRTVIGRHISTDSSDNKDISDIKLKLSCMQM